MKIYAITFLAVAGLTFSLATAPLDTLYWLLFALELPSAIVALVSFIPILIFGIIIQICPAILILVVSWLVADSGAGR